MHMVLVFVLDGLSQHSCLNPALTFQARAGFRHLCWDRPISHSNQCHMHIISHNRRIKCNKTLTFNGKHCLEGVCVIILVIPYPQKRMYMYVYVYVQLFSLEYACQRYVFYLVQVIHICIHYTEVRRLYIWRRKTKWRPNHQPPLRTWRLETSPRFRCGILIVDIQYGNAG